jgi:hypothetical protein
MRDSTDSTLRHAGAQRCWRCRDPALRPPSLCARQVGAPGVKVSDLLDRATAERPELVAWVAERDKSEEIDTVRDAEQDLNLRMVAEVEGGEASAKAGGPCR